MLTVADVKRLRHAGTASKARVLVIGGKDRDEILEPVLETRSLTAQRIVDPDARTKASTVAFPGGERIQGRARRDHHRPALRREAHVQYFLGPSRQVPGVF